jgi:DNA-binding NarL/FixJ family response regulator
MTIGKTQTTTIFLVDDHAIVRAGLWAVLDQTPGLSVVGEAATPEDAVTGVKRLHPNIVLMDIHLANHDNCSGIEAAREILSCCPGSHVLFLTSYMDDETVMAAILSGAHGYVLKDIALEDLVRAIRTVAAGESLLDPQVTTRTMDWLRTTAGAGGQDAPQPLSPQEKRILPLVADGKTNKEIAVVLNLSDKTVKNYLANIFTKLNITRRSQAAALYARSVPHAASVR